jgi:hypothetical protein
MLRPPNRGVEGMATMANYTAFVVLAAMGVARALSAPPVEATAGDAFRPPTRAGGARPPA